MIGPIRFIVAIIWFAIGLGVVGTLKDCIATMAQEAAIANKRGGISYGNWNRQLVGGNSSNAMATRNPAMAGTVHQGNLGKENITRPKE